MLLVTGITGHTGRYFLQELIDHKYEGAIRCIVRETSDTSMLDKSGLNIEKVYGDLNDKNFIREVMSGVDIIMHIYNIHHSPMIVEAAIENNVKRAILVHTTGIYSNFKYASQGYKDVEKKVSELKDGSLIITDIFGGTTTNVAAKLSLSYNINIISGLNAPLLFEALLNIDSINEDEVLDSIVEEGRDSCKNILKELKKMTK